MLKEGQTAALKRFLCAHLLHDYVVEAIGFIVNPIAGMGGPVGLKGTDGADTLEEALRRGAKARAVERAREAVSALAMRGLDIRILTCAGEMGETALAGSGIPSEVVYSPESPTSPEDTRRGVEAMVGLGARLIVFSGGDGTARDIVGVVGSGTPIVGVPAGVKMHSSVFALTPADAADLVAAFLRSGVLRDGEVMDVDEDDFRDGIVRSTLHGIARVPDDEAHLQPAKSSYSSGGDDAEADEIAACVAEEMEDGVLYILGPGSTTAAISKVLGQPKTPLGVDAYIDGKVIGRDLSEDGIAELLGEHPEARIVVTPIGAQGFVFGRGNQQISPEVIRKVGVQNVTIVATPSKLKHTPYLRVDTGDAALDSELRGPVKVLTGYRRRRLSALV